MELYNPFYNPPQCTATIVKHEKQCYQFWVDSKKDPTIVNPGAEVLEYELASENEESSVYGHGLRVSSSDKE